MLTSSVDWAEIESQLSLKLQDLYVQSLGQKPTNLICQLSEHSISVVIEAALTKAELLLNASGDSSLAQKVGASIDNILRPQFEQLIEETVQRKILTLVTTTRLETKRRTITAIFEEKDS